MCISQYKATTLGMPVHVVARSECAKTGNVPQVYFGDSLKEVWLSCNGCKLRPLYPGASESLLGSFVCYAWSGSPWIGACSSYKARQRNSKRYHWSAALDKRNPDAKMVRFGALGDPSAADRNELFTAINATRALGLAAVGYTHFWASGGSDLRGQMMASCDSLAEADDAIEADWRVAVVLPKDHVGDTFETPNGHKGIVCPALRRDNLTCNDCRLCDASRKAKHIGFPDHGPHSK